MGYGGTILIPRSPHGERVENPEVNLSVPSEVRRLLFERQSKSYLISPIKHLTGIILARKFRK
jgi:hypothetical protein